VFFSDDLAHPSSILQFTAAAERRGIKPYRLTPNKKEWTCTLKIVGNVKMVGGVTINMTNWGKYSGKYMVDMASHKTGGGYLTTVNAHKVLGY
jgi:hypothetical protein